MPILRAILCAALAVPLLSAQDRKGCVEACMRAWNDAARACVERHPAGGAGLDACLHAALAERNRCIAACPEGAADLRLPWPMQTPGLPWTWAGFLPCAADWSSVLGGAAPPLRALINNTYWIPAIRPGLCPGPSAR